MTLDTDDFAPTSTRESDTEFSVRVRAQTGHEPNDLPVAEVRALLGAHIVCRRGSEYVIALTEEQDGMVGDFARIPDLLEETQRTAAVQAAEVAGRALDPTISRSRLAQVAREFKSDGARAWGLAGNFGDTEAAELIEQGWRLREAAKACFRAADVDICA